MNVKTLCMIFALTWLVPIGGCGSDPAARVAMYEETLAIVAEQSAQMDDRLVQLDALLASGRAVLADPNTTDDLAARIVAEIDAVQAELAKVAPAKAQADRVIAQLRSRIAEVQAGGNPDLTGELGVLATGLSATGAALGGETGKWLTLAASLLTGVLAVFARQSIVARKAVEAEKADLNVALTEVVQGGQLFKKAAAAAPTEDGTVLFKQAQVDAQRSGKTRELVAVARTKVTV